MQVCVALGLLSQSDPNKRVVAGKGGVAAMVRLLEDFKRSDRATIQVLHPRYLLRRLLVHPPPPVSRVHGPPLADRIVCGTGRFLPASAPPSTRVRCPAQSWKRRQILCGRRPV